MGGQSLGATDVGSSEGLLSQALLIPLFIEKRGNPRPKLQSALDVNVVRCASQQPSCRATMRQGLASLRVSLSFQTF